MTPSRTHLPAIVLAALALPRGGEPCRAAAPAAVQAPLFEELGGEPYVSEVIRHLYRWYLDERDVEARLSLATFDVWARRLDVTLDEGDRSRFAEIVIPIFNVYVNVKKADYRVDELNLEVRGRQYRIVNVAQGEAPAQPPAEYAVLTMSMPALLDRLFQTRNLREYPDEALTARLRDAVRIEAEKHAETAAAQTQVTHVGPLSPVSNELWAFWETGRMLLHFTSDVDIDNPVVWEQERLQLRTYDIDRQVVLSLSEVPGSNAFLTRDQVGRCLYNCIVLGERREVPTSRSVIGEVHGAAGQD